MVRSAYLNQKIAEIAQEAGRAARSRSQEEVEELMYEVESIRMGAIRSEMAKKHAQSYKNGLIRATKIYR